ncbi:bifunctional acetate--CoA ligase family protein/GNAT family N-acetyltransferase [Trinickia mobilis]|uniref:bifunctional acetate--CoA ligase family protein/GNAT family N-acetyltransferase n=1 Tax=Trinickia mobilis TaxID=2816356 RepID=UPI001A8CA4A3|nr:GNAT family N-acetyltransferase [Trinickia mobilis]
MTVRNLDALFRPESVAVIGASLRPRSVGAMVWARVLEGGFAGPVWPVNPKYAELSGFVAFGDVRDLPEAPTVALICTPPATWPAIVRKLGKLGTRAAIILGEARRSDECTALAQALAAARPYLLRIVGPGSVGVITPALSARFSASPFPVKEGGVAWVSQSNAITNAVLGWAHARGLGFSHAIALGDEADVDAGDALDYLASDPNTHAILLELETVRAARKFMSAARAAARNKPVLALRSGRADPDDALYSSAFQRAGVVRVHSLDDLLDEIETLGVGRVAASSTATLITSDRGVATLAADAFAAAGDALAQWPGDAARAVAEALPHLSASRDARPGLPGTPPGGASLGGNPLLLGDDARPEHFARALEALAPHRDTGTAFVVHAPTHSAPVAEVARVLIESQKFAYRGLLACFFGGVDNATRDALHAHGIPVHTTPQRLARAFARLVDYRLVRELLMQTPEGLPAQVPEAIDCAHAQAKRAVAAGQTELSGEAAARIFECFGLTVLREHALDTASVHAYRGGVTEGGIVQTRDAGDCPDPAAAAAAAAADDDDAKIVDLAVELRDDANFGPVFRYTAPSADGVSAPVCFYSLPPLNPILSREVISRSPYARAVSSIEPVLAALTALSQAVCDVKEMAGLTVTLRVTRTRAMLVAPRVTVAATRSRLAIVPYPRRLEETIDWRGARLTIRPIRPEDETAHNAFIKSMTSDDLRLRFFGAVRRFDHSQLARMTQIDYDREMALIATARDENGMELTLGVVRAITDPDNEAAEFALAIRSDQKGKGLGRLLMTKIIEYVRSRGTRWIVGEVLAENAAMIGLAKAMGFAVSRTDDPGVVGVRLALGERASA